MLPMWRRGHNTTDQHVNSKTLSIEVSEAEARSLLVCVDLGVEAIEGTHLPSSAPSDTFKFVQREFDNLVRIKDALQGFLGLTG